MKRKKGENVKQLEGNLFKEVPTKCQNTENTIEYCRTFKFTRENKMSEVFFKRRRVINHQTGWAKI